MYYWLTDHCTINIWNDFLINYSLWSNGTMLSIVDYKYNDNCISDIEKWTFGTNWPSVYITYNDKTAWVTNICIDISTYTSL